MGYHPVSVSYQPAVSPTLCFGIYFQIVKLVLWYIIDFNILSLQILNKESITHSETQPYRLDVKLFHAVH